MTASHDEMLDSVAAYALGVLPVSERDAVEQHLRSCAECAAEYAFLRPAVTALAYSAESCEDSRSGAAVASPMLKARIMSRVRAQASAARRSTPRNWAVGALAAACVVFAVITGVANLTLRRDVQATRAHAAQQAQTIADLTAGDARRYAFSGGEVIARGARLYLVMRDLRRPPVDRVYQAWTLPRGSTRMAPAGTFLPSGGGTTLVRLAQNPQSVTAVAVSIEPVGGSKQPTTKPIAVVPI